MFKTHFPKKIADEFGVASFHLADQYRIGEHHHIISFNVNADKASEEIRRAARLQRFFPESASEADFHRTIFLRGLLVLEAEVVGAGGPPPPGQSEAALVGILIPRILTVLALLERHGKLPRPAVAGGGPSEAAPTTLQPPTDDGIDMVDASADDDMQSLGADFL